MRPAAADEADQLTELCLRSKAVHGYDSAFMAAVRAELTVHLNQPGSRLMVAARSGKPVGLAEVMLSGTTAELDKLFVEPDEIGSGVGSRLFDWARGEAAAAGAETMTIVADPGSRDFYLAKGAVDDGVSASGSIPGRFLPRLRLHLRGGSQP